MAHLVINRSTHTVRIPLVIEWCRNSSHIRCHVIHNFVNLRCLHPLMDILFYVVKDCNVNFCTLLNLLDILRIFDDIMIRHNMSKICKMLDFIVEVLMARFVFAPTPTPARVISSNLNSHVLSISFILTFFA